MTDYGYRYEYDEDLPYVVETALTGRLVARFSWRDEAEGYLDVMHINGSVIDTTPKPRVPADARFITWLVNGSGRWYAERTNGDWYVDGASYGPALKKLPGVTPDTVFTVLDERKN